jgi:branched-chain amino acid transport system permease protein
MVAIFGVIGIADQHGLPWWLYIPLAILIAAIFGTIVGALAVRTEGIYTIMITLAIAAAFFYFTRQNYTSSTAIPASTWWCRRSLFGVDWRQPMPFYYLTLGCAVLCLSARWSMSRARRSGWRCKACATTRGAWRRLASTSPRTGSRPIPLPA